MEENESEKNDALQCDQCKHKISYAGDVISVEKCVNGPRGVIPLGEVMRFCCEDCVSKYFQQEPASNLKEIGQRIP